MKNGSHDSSGKKENNTRHKNTKVPINKIIVDRRNIKQQKKNIKTFSHIQVN